MDERHPPDHHRKTDKPCFIRKCKNQSYEHIPYIPGLNWGNHKTFHNGEYNNKMVACIYHFERIWNGEY